MSISSIRIRPRALTIDWKSLMIDSFKSTHGYKCTGITLTILIFLIYYVGDFVLTLWVSHLGNNTALGSTQHPLIAFTSLDIIIYPALAMPLLYAMLSMALCHIRQKTLATKSIWQYYRLEHLKIVWIVALPWVVSSLGMVSIIQHSHLILFFNTKDPMMWFSAIALLALVMMVWGNYTTRMSMFLMEDLKIKPLDACRYASKACWRFLDQLCLYYLIMTILLAMGLLTFGLALIWVIPMKPLLDAKIYQCLFHHANRILDLKELSE